MFVNFSSRTVFNKDSNVNTDTGTSAESQESKNLLVSLSTGAGST